MDVADAAAALACTAGLLLTVLAFGDLPLLGSAFGAVVSGAVAGLLARGPRGAAAAALAAGSVGAAAVVFVGLLGGTVVPGRLAAGGGDVVQVVQGALVAFAPAAIAAAVARLAARLLPSQRPASEGPPPRAP